MKDNYAFCIVTEEDKYRAIDQVISSCTLFDEIPEKEKFIQAVHRRERVQSTGIGHGVAIAHGKTGHLDGVHIALGFSEKGIIFDDRYPDPVHLLFVIASSPTKESEYLRAVASILTWVHDSFFRTLLVERSWDDERVRIFFSMLDSQRFSPQQV